MNLDEEKREYIKHFQYMTKEERVYLMSLKTSAQKRGITFAKHAWDRMDERYIKEKDVILAIKNGQIVEYKKTETDEILTIRGCSLSKRKEQIYVILSIRSGKVITTYSNKYWIAYSKSSTSPKYTNDFNIQIPDFFKRKLALYY